MALVYFASSALISGPVVHHYAHPSRRPSPGDRGQSLAALEKVAVYSAAYCAAFAAPGVARSTVMPARANIDAIDVNNFVLSQTGYWRSNARMELKTQSTAVFGNVTIPLREDLSLFLGGRYSVLDKPYNYVGSTNAVGAPLVFAPFTTSSGSTLKELSLIHI